MNEKERAAMQQALDRLRKYHHGNGFVEDAECIVALEAALATPVPHGCHVDLDEGIEPDGCVLDEGRPEKCIYAKRLHREGKDKTACKYWQPIEVKK